MNFRESFFNKPKQEQKVEKILPEDVRYALAYNKALLNKNLIEILNNNHFVPESTYLITKALNLSNQDRFAYVNEIIKEYISKETTEKHIIDINQKYIDTLDPLSEVDAMKLGQLSRQGFNFWQEKYSNFAKTVSQRQETPFLLANAPIIGLEYFAKEFSKHKKEFGILFPKSIEQTSKLEAYSYTFQEGEFVPSILDENSLLPEHILLLDDVKNTGETEIMIKKYFTEHYPDSTVSYESVSQTKNPS